ncbi:MAG: hypothetical protein QM775_04120 [Pirellulales bacterium]
MRTAVLFAFVGCLAVGCLALAADTKPAADNDSPYHFGGKIVAVSMNDAELSCYLSRAAVERLGARDFIVGYSPPFPGFEGLEKNRIWLPLSDVTHIMEFDSVEQAAEAYGKLEEWKKKAEQQRDGVK